MTAVPRLFEAVYHRIMKKVCRPKVGARKSSCRRWRSVIDTPKCRISTSKCRALALRQKIADKLVFTKWREEWVAGCATLSLAARHSRRHCRTLFWLQAFPSFRVMERLRLVLFQPTGPTIIAWDSIGLPFTGIDVAIAEDGEIMLRGPNVMVGYYGHGRTATRC